MKIFSILILGCILGCASKALPPSDRTLQGLSRNQINDTVKANRKDVKECYDAALTTNPNLKGKIALFFHIEKTGKVGDAEVSKDTIKEETLSNCLVEKARLWTFPESTETTDVRAYPFYFHKD